MDRNTSLDYHPGVRSYLKLVNETERNQIIYGIDRRIAPTQDQGTIFVFNFFLILAKKYKTNVDKNCM